MEASTHVSALERSAVVHATHPAPAGCIVTAQCRANFRQPWPVRVHYVVDTDRFGGEIRGSWLHSALIDKVLDCSDGKASTDGKPVFATRRFDPLRANDTARHEAELFFIQIDSSWFSRGRVSLVGCGEQLALSMSHDVRTVWRGDPRGVSHDVPSLGRVLRAASPHAAIVFSDTVKPDVGDASVRMPSDWLTVRGIDPTERALEACA